MSDWTERSIVAMLVPALAVIAGCAEDAGPTGPLPGLPPTLLGVEPGVLRAGDTATLRGLNFAETAAENQVRLEGASVPVTSATGTSLRARIPGAGDLPCRPTRRVPLRVSVSGGGSDTISPRLSVAPAVSLDPGGFEAASDPARISCREFPAVDDTFFVSVFNANRAPGETVGFEVSGVPGEGEEADDASATRGTGIGGEGVAFDPRQLPPALREAALANAGHHRVLERNRRLLRRLGPVPAGTRGEGRTGANAARAAVAAGDGSARAVGDLVPIRVPDLTEGDICAEYREVTARVVHVTEHAVLLSDTANPIDGRFDDRLTEMGDEFEERMWPVLRENFGDPLRMDSVLNDDGRLHMLFTPEVNSFGNVLAFVFSGDFFPRQGPEESSCEASDEAEVFYSRAPTFVDEENFASLDATAGWQWTLRPTVMHEVKHLVAYAERISRGLSLETLWLEESSAHLAEELYAREVFGFGQGEETDYRESLYCSVRAQFPEQFPGCAGRPLVMFSEFQWLAEYMRNPASRTALGPFGSAFAYRGTGWHLLRWAIDHAPVDEAAFLTELTRSPTVGVENLEARAGREFGALMADWTLSLALDGRGEGLERPELTTPSWDLRDVYRGLHEDYGTSLPLFSEEYPLAEQTRGYISFSDQVSAMPGGGSLIYRLTGREEATELLEITGPGGGDLPPGLRISVARSP